MKLQTKKRLAKEIIIFFSSIILALLFFLSTYPYNWIYQKKISNLTETISIKERTADSLSSSYKAKLKKQNWFYNEISKDFDISEYKTSDENWSRLQEIINRDSLEYQYKNTWGKDLVSFLSKLGFKNAIQFKEFILLNSFTKTEKTDYNKAIAINDEIKEINSEINNKENNLLSFDEQKENGIKSLIIILTIVYPLRFLYLLITWALKTMKQKENQ